MGAANAPGHVGIHVAARAGRLGAARGADEQKPAKDGTVEAWARSESNPLTEREHQPRNNGMRAR